MSTTIGHHFHQSHSVRIVRRPTCWCVTLRTGSIMERIDFFVRDEAAAHALAAGLEAAVFAEDPSAPRCTSCRLPVESVNEADECDGCQQARANREMAYWKPLYDGEVRAGLHNPEDAA